MRVLQIWYYEIAHPVIFVSISAEQRLKRALVGSTLLRLRLTNANSASVSAQYRGCSVAKQHRPRKNL